MASDIYTRLREAEKRATKAEWVVSHDKHEQANIHGDGNWVGLFPHQCVTSLVAEANANADLIALTRNTLPEMLAVAVAARKVRLIEKQRDHDEDNYGEAWQTYSAKSLLEAWTELDFALSALEAKGKA